MYFIWTFSYCISLWDLTCDYDESGNFHNARMSLNLYHKAPVCSYAGEGWLLYHVKRSDSCWSLVGRSTHWDSESLTDAVWGWMPGDRDQVLGAHLFNQSAQISSKVWTQQSRFSPGWLVTLAHAMPSCSMPRAICLTSSDIQCIMGSIGNLFSVQQAENF